MAPKTQWHYVNKSAFSEFSGKVLYVLGLQYGDEGKGKLVDEIAGHFDAVCRAGGGANAGHTIWRGDTKFVTHLLPSGVLHPHTLNVIGAGVVVDPIQLAKEIDQLCQGGTSDAPPLTPQRLCVDPRATAVLRCHVLEDIEKEERRLQKMGKPIGTTGKGIGPAHGARAQREALRLGALVAAAQSSPQELTRLLGTAGVKGYTDSHSIEELCQALRCVAPFCQDASSALNGVLERGGKVLIEGAQGALLDLLFGSYPYVSSGQAHPGAALAGLGIPVHTLGAVWGVTKCYATRVGEGPFPGEIQGPVADNLREVGREYGSTTGRPRRVGHLDLSSLRYVCRTFGVTALALMKGDVLNGFENLSAVKEVLPSVQHALAGEHFSVRLHSLPGWNHVTAQPTLSGSVDGGSQAVTFSAPFTRFMQEVEEAAQCPVTYVSLGPKHGEGAVGS